MNRLLVLLSLYQKGEHMKKIGCILSVMLSSTAVLAGPSSSGGGFAVVCRQIDGRIQSAELLDLYEGRVKNRFQYFNSTGDVIADYVISTNIGYRLQGSQPPEDNRHIKANISAFLNKANWVTAPDQLPNLHDTGETIPIPDQCNLEPVAIYYDRNDKVDIDRSIWEALDSQSKAALVTHELIYNYLRGISLNPSTNSEEARVLTASWFSTNLTPVNSGVPTNAERRVFFAKIIDNGHGGMSHLDPTVFYFINSDVSGSRKTRIQFTHIAGRPLLSKTYFDIRPGTQLGDDIPIQSSQILGWTAQLVKDNSRSNNELKVVLKKQGSYMGEFPL